MEADRHEALGTGYTRVDTEVSCLLTRFRVRSVWSLVRCYRAFLRVRRQARSVPGLLKAIFVVEDMHTCYTLSLWTDADAILDFNLKANAHVRAANWSFRDLRRDESGPQLFSAQFRLSAVSPHNLRWRGVDLAPHFTPVTPSQETRDAA